jgi:hypothetical protein
VSVGVSRCQSVRVGSVSFGVVSVSFRCCSVVSVLFGRFGVGAMCWCHCRCRCQCWCRCR